MSWGMGYYDYLGLAENPPVQLADLHTLVGKLKYHVHLGKCD